jgi:hypothetical protein
MKPTYALKHTRGLLRVSEENMLRGAFGVKEKEGERK